MNIGFDAKRLFYNSTGLGNYSRTLVRNLALNYPDNKLLLYTPTIKKNYFSEEFFNGKYEIRTSTDVIKAWWRSSSVVNDFEKDNVELYHGLSNELPFGIHRVKAKSVVTIHDLIFKKYPNTYTFADRSVYDLKFKMSCQNADRIIAISQHTKNDIVHYYKISPEKIEVIYQAVDDIFYKMKAEVELKIILEKYNLPENYLLNVGSVIERKNLLRLVKAVEQLPDSLKIPLVIVGDGKKYKAEVLQFIHSRKIEKHFIWLSNLTSNEELQAVYQGASALIYPSVYEGFGLPVSEALLCKTPVITSNVSSLPEAGGPNSLLVNPTSIEEIKAAIEKVLTDADLRKSMIDKGFEYANENFNPQKSTQLLMNLYKNCVAK